MNNQRDTANTSPEASSEWTDNIPRWSGIMFFIYSIVLTLLIAIYSLSSSVSPNVSAYAANTFLQTSVKGASEYTWVSWDVIDYQQNFTRCTQTARIFDDVCEPSDNLTLYQLCIQDKYPQVSYCMVSKYNNGVPPFPFLTMGQAFLSCFSNFPEANDFQKEVLQRCLSPDQRPIFTVLQDKDSKHYLGSYNSGIVLFTSVYIIMLFLLYTTYNPATAGENDDNDMVRPKLFRYKDANDTNCCNMGWYRTGYWITLICFSLSCLLVIILTIFTWRLGDLIGTPMTVHTSIVCMMFALLITYYFGMEMWEKQYIDTVEEYKKTDGDGRISQMQPSNPLGLYMTVGKYEPNQRQVPLLVFPWAESNFFVEPLMFIGILGLQNDITTWEITEIFNVIVYSSVACIIFAYDYHTLTFTSDKVWYMSFCSNMATFFFQLVPLTFIIQRFKTDITDTINLPILIFGILNWFMYLFKLGWHRSFQTPASLFYDECIWLGKVFKQLFFVTIIFFLARNNFLLNATLKDDVNVWLVNY